MATVVTEGRFRLTVPEGVRVRKFDDSSHGLSHCMKAVDRVVDDGRRTILVEVKDFSPRKDLEPRALKERDVGSWVGKFRDSLLYLWAEEACGHERWCVVLLCGIDRALMNVPLTALRRQLPEGIPREVRTGWRRAPVGRALVLAPAGWRRLFPDWRLDEIRT